MGKLDIEWFKARSKAQIDQDKLAHQISVDAVEMGLQMQAAKDNKLNAEAQPT
jgi:hypothetical protein